MEYAIRLDAVSPDLTAITDALLDIDPAAIADLDTDGHTLRLSTNMLDCELVDALARSGNPVSTDQIQRLPSICCGSCSG